MILSETSITSLRELVYGLKELKKIKKFKISLE